MYCISNPAYAAMYETLEANLKLCILRNIILKKYIGYKLFVNTYTL